MSSRSSEDVLLILNQVRHKKTDGVLYLMGERLGWMVESKSTFTLSYLYTDIKAQKISPDSKDKVQLQIILHDGGAKTFHFTNRKGRDAAIADRNSVKELLQQLLPQHRQKISSELEDKKRHLQDDPETFQLYKDLVVSGVISAEEFWASRADKLGNTGKTGDNKQSVGISAAFLAEVKPQTDGCNGLKYNLTADIIESIFRTYPMVKIKHAENVPHNMTESEFWTRFFQSHYFHRDRSTIGSKDVFSDCAKNDDKEIAEEISKTVNDPILDLTQLNDSSLDDGYGDVTGDRKKSSNNTNLTMIRRFNHHSTMVLKACDNQSTSKSGDLSSGASTSGISDKNSNNSNGVTVLNGHMPDTGEVSDSSEPVCKRAKIQEKIHYDDLGNKNTASNVNLRLHKLEGYLHGPTPAMLSRYTHTDDAVAASKTVSKEMAQWRQDLSSVLSETVALGVLGELSPGGSLMKGTEQHQLNQMVTPDAQEELRTQYNALLELLRHFWTCFPANTKFLEEKVVRMKSTLERFQFTKLAPLKEKLQQYRYTVDLTGHMEELLLSAYTKYDQWQTKKTKKL